MRADFIDLLEILDKECKIYAKIINLEKEKKQSIIDNDVAALEAVTKKEQGFVKTIVNLSELRAQVVDGFCKSRNIKNYQKLDDIINELDSFEKNGLISKKEKLVEITNELLEVNDLNAKLIEQSIQYINYSLELVGELNQAEIGYDEKAKDIAVSKDKPLFDAKV